jgi:Uma2 family endonuclease
MRTKPHRESFSPDAAYHVGQPMGMRFPQGAPVFAVEVRSENDYGRAAARAMRDKRADYFACGTLVVWGVDLQSADVVKSYKASDPENPVTFRRAEVAHGGGGIVWVKANRGMSRVAVHMR